jgi:hypothetical protein
MLLILGIALAAAIGGMAALGDLGLHARPMLLLWGAAHLVYVLAAWLVLRRGAGRRTLWIVLGFGFLARLALLPTAPTLSEDVYRYLWDGRLVAHGVNPFPHAPADPALARFQDALLHRLNHANVPTIYPPAAQGLFAATALVSATPVAWKLLLLALETALVLALLGLLRARGLPRERLLLYYWNPLALVESFGSGHLDLAAAAFLALALWAYEARRPARAGIAYALAVMTKYIPALLVPWLVRRRAWALLAVAAAVSILLAAPFLSAGSALTTGLRTYALHWEFNSAAYHLMRHLTNSELAIRRELGAAALLASLVVAWRARSMPAAAFGCLVCFLLLSPTVFPWYAVPVAALLPLVPDPGMIAFSGLIALSYLPLPGYRETGVWSLPPWILAVEYGGLAAVWAAAALRARVRVDQRENAHVEESEEVEREEG